MILPSILTKLVDMMPKPKPSDNIVAHNVTSDKTAININMEGFRSKNGLFFCKVFKLRTMFNPLPHDPLGRLCPAVETV